MSEQRALRVLLGVLVLALVASGGCGDGEKSKRGIKLMPDMMDTPAYRRQVAMVVPADISDDGKVQDWPSLLPPVAGTVSRAGPTYPYAASDLKHPVGLMNPLSPTAEVLAEGQYRFLTYCAVCHGRDGDASNGYVAKYFTGIPSLNAAHLTQLTDGQIYHIITVGQGRMPSYAAQVLPTSRWALVSFLRVLNRVSLARQDIEAQILADRKQCDAHPEDGNLKAQLERDEHIAQQRARDLAAITAVGPDAGRSFVPLPDPRPEYEPAQWPSGPTTQEPGK